MKILITGGAGFVGRWFTGRLLEQGAEVCVVDNLIPGGGGVAPSSGWLLGNPLDYDRFAWIQQDCRAFFEEQTQDDWDVVIHLAAVVGGRLTIERNPLAVAEDLQIDSAFWRFVSRRPPVHIIHFSSSAAYPVALQTATSHRPLRESDIDFKKPLGTPDLTYGWAKLTSEFLSQVAIDKVPSQIATYRPFSGFGEDQDLSYPFPSIMKRAIEQVDAGSDVINVWGSGLQQRDFIHIDDVVSSVLATYRHLTAAEPLNLGSGVGTNFADLARRATRYAGRELEVRASADKPEGVYARVADDTQFRLRGCRLERPLDSAIRAAIDYWRSRPR